MNLTNCITTRASAILAQRSSSENPYFSGLSDGSLDLEGFRRTQEQFFYAVTFFPRPMAALIGRIPHPRQRLDILGNLLEEHGHLDESAFHHSTFQLFLERLGCDITRLDAVSLWPEVRAFNSVLTTACVFDELEVGVACMGIIEHAFAGISASIGSAVVARGWISAERLVHYKLHAEIDMRHAEEFYAVIAAGWNDAQRRYHIEQGLELGSYILDRLYRDLALRAHAGPA